jgi:hypothetical protein
MPLEAMLTIDKTDLSRHHVPRSLSDRIAGYLAEDAVRGNGQ